MQPEEKWKPSQFNEFLDSVNNKWVIYNNLSGAMIEVPKTIYDGLIHGQLVKLSEPKHLKALQYGKFIVSSDKNELDEFKKIKNEVIDSCRVIGLQILPFSGCGFKCLYCYELPGNKTQMMSKKVMDDILDYLRFKIKPTTEYLNLLWYGGEPTMAIDRIQYLSESFLKIANEKNINYRASMVTNGYLLTPKNIDKLIKNNVKVYQVTIDGPEKIHDRRRMLRNGGKTYRRIIDNLKYAVSKKINVSIRINIDKTNIGSIEELFLDLQRNEIFNKVSFSFGLVTRFGKVCKSIEDTLLTIEKADEILKQKKIEQLIAESKNSAIRPIPDFIGCVATAKNSLIIGPDGELYKCSKTFGDMDEVCGNISNPDLESKNLKKWENIDNLAVETCKNCSMIPICRGISCAFDLLIKKEDIYNCNFESYHQDYLKILKTLYIKKIKL